MSSNLVELAGKHTQQKFRIVIKSKLETIALHPALLESIEIMACKAADIYRRALNHPDTEARYAGHTLKFLNMQPSTRKNQIFGYYGIGEMKKDGENNSTRQLRIAASFLFSLDQRLKSGMSESIFPPMIEYYFHLVQSTSIPNSFDYAQRNARTRHRAKNEFKKKIVEMAKNLIKQGVIRKSVAVEKIMQQLKIEESDGEYSRDFVIRQVTGEEFGWKRGRPPKVV
jgi:hypothetical protein